MSEWIDIPAHRVLLVDRMEFQDKYVRLNKNGQPVRQGEQAELIRRDDGKVFRMARYMPSSVFLNGQIALVEW